MNKHILFMMIQTANWYREHNDHISLAMLRQKYMFIYGTSLKEKLREHGYKLSEKNVYSFHKSYLKQMEKEKLTYFSNLEKSIELGLAPG